MRTLSHFHVKMEGQLLQNKTANGRVSGRVPNDVACPARSSGDPPAGTCCQLMSPAMLPRNYTETAVATF